jgi:hypothetical protein
MIHVVSTGMRAPTRRICEGSVRAQTRVGCDVRHVYIDAADQCTPMPASYNVWSACRDLPPDDIVVWLDGDDWLAHDGVLSIVLHMHRCGAWVTYGQYMTADGQRGHCARYAPRDVRSQPWLASHLRTFRSGLMRYVDAEDLQVDGEWVTRGVDVAIMLPLLELAGHDRSMYCDTVLAVYNTSSAWETSARGVDLDHESAIVTRIRAKRPKERLACM